MYLFGGIGTLLSRDSYRLGSCPVQLEGIEPVRISLHALEVIFSEVVDGNVYSDDTTTDCPRGSLDSQTIGFKGNLPNDESWPLSSFVATIGR